MRFPGGVHTAAASAVPSGGALTVRIPESEVVPAEYGDGTSWLSKGLRRHPDSTRVSLVLRWTGTG